MQLTLTVPAAPLVPPPGGRETTTLPLPFDVVGVLGVVPPFELIAEHVTTAVAYGGSPLS